MKRVSPRFLKNGFTWYTCFDHKNYVSGVGFRAGSIHDPRHLIGMNHLTEHIIGDFGYENELRFEEYGCGPDEDINIRVDRSSTFYGHGLVLQREFMLNLFDIFSRGVRDISKISEEMLKRECAAVLNEYHLRGKDWIENSIEDWLHEIMYVNNPVRSRIDCEPEHLKQITIRDVRQYYRRNYGADTAFALIFGVPHRKTKKMMEERFSDLRPTKRKPLAIPDSDIRPNMNGIKYVEVEKKGIGQYHVAIGFPTWQYGHKDSIAIDVLGHVLQWNLRHILRDQNTDRNKGTYRVFVHTPRTFAHGMIYIWFATPDKEYAEEGAKKIIEECVRMRENLIPEKLFCAFWNKLYYKHKTAFDTEPDTLAELVIEATCNGDLEMQRLNSYLGRLQCVGKKAIFRVANEYLNPNNCVYLLIKPSLSAEPNEKVTTEMRETKDIRRTVSLS